MSSRWACHADLSDRCHTSRISSHRMRAHRVFSCGAGGGLEQGGVGAGVRVRRHGQGEGRRGEKGCAELGSRGDMLQQASCTRFAAGTTHASTTLGVPCSMGDCGTPGWHRMPAAFPTTTVPGTKYSTEQLLWLAGCQAHVLGARALHAVLKAGAGLGQRAPRARQVRPAPKVPVAARHDGGAAPVVQGANKGGMYFMSRSMFDAQVSGCNAGRPAAMAGP